MDFLKLATDILKLTENPNKAEGISNLLGDVLGEDSEQGEKGSKKRRKGSKQGVKGAKLDIPGFDLSDIPDFDPSNLGMAQITNLVNTRKKKKIPKNLVNKFTGYIIAVSSMLIGLLGIIFWLKGVDSIWGISFMAIGGLSFLIQVIRNKSLRPTLGNIVGVLILLAGLVMIISPSLFTHGMKYVFYALIIIAWGYLFFTVIRNWEYIETGKITSVTMTTLIVVAVGVFVYILYSKNASEAIDVYYGRYLLGIPLLIIGVWVKHITGQLTNND